MKSKFLGTQATLFAKRQLHGTSQVLLTDAYIQAYRTLHYSRQSLIQ